MPEGTAERIALWAGRRGFSLLYPGSGGEGARFEAREWREGATGCIVIEFGKLAKLERARVTRVERLYIREQTFEALLEFCGFRHFSVWKERIYLCDDGVAVWWGVVDKNGGNIRINPYP